MNKQKGLAPILTVLLIALAVGGYLLYQNQNKPVVPQQTVQSTPAPTSNPELTSSVDITNWKTFKITSSKGFGYEITLPSSWISMKSGWTEGEQPLPEELAQAFFDKNCTVNKGKIMILHFLSSDPQKDIEKSINGLKKDGFTETVIQNKSGSKIKKLTGNLVGVIDYYAYFSSTRGYYYVSGRDECVANYGQIFDQILSTFKFTQ